MGDAAAALVGKKIRIGEYSIFGNKKTISGSVAMFVSSFISLFIYFSITNLDSFFPTIVVSILLGLIGTICEGVTPYGLDNLTIPVLVSSTYYLLLR